MSLFDRPPIEATPASTPAPRQEYTVILKQTRSGRQIMVCTAPTAPAEVIAEAAEKGLPLFTGQEIARMTNCDPDMVAHILEVKLTWPGISVEQILTGAVQG